MHRSKVSLDAAIANILVRKCIEIKLMRTYLPCADATKPALARDSEMNIMTMPTAGKYGASLSFTSSQRNIGVVLSAPMTNSVRINSSKESVNANSKVATIAGRINGSTTR